MKKVLGQNEQLKVIFLVFFMKFTFTYRFLKPEKHDFTALYLNGTSFFLDSTSPETPFTAVGLFPTEKDKLMLSTQTFHGLYYTDNNNLIKQLLK